MTLPESPLSLGPTSGRIAFFDVDNTMLRGSTLFLMARGLYKRGFFAPRELTQKALAQLRFRISGKERKGEMVHIRESALAFIKGQRVSQLGEIAEEIYEERIKEAIWNGTLDLARAHLAAGDEVWLVTATPIEVANVMVERLGLSGALGTVAESKDGIYTGFLVGELLHGGAKAAAVAKLAEGRRVDLANCVAYSDSANDLPMLNSVGDPHVINPDSKLRRHAKRADWPIHDFRHARRIVRILAPWLAIVGIIVAARG